MGRILTHRDAKHEFQVAKLLRAPAGHCECIGVAVGKPRICQAQQFLRLLLCQDALAPCTPVASANLQQPVGDWELCPRWWRLDTSRVRTKHRSRVCDVRRTWWGRRAGAHAAVRTRGFQNGAACGRRREERIGIHDERVVALQLHAPAACLGPRSARRLPAGPGTESLIEQPVVQSEHGRRMRYALVLVAVAACVTAVIMYRTGGVQIGRQSTDTVQLIQTTIENDQCTSLQGVEARCKYAQWDSSISRSNDHVDVTCVPTRARTNGKCSDWCAKYGYICLRAQDNDGNCKVNKNHANRGKSTANNGCEQDWGDQICQCGKKLCQDAHSCASENMGRYGSCSEAEKRRCPVSCKVCRHSGI